MGAEKGEAEATGVGEEQPQGPEVETAGGATTTGHEADVLRSQLEEERARADRNLANWQRAQADFSNFKKRAEQERAELVSFANASLIGRLLPILDDFERALGAVPEELRSTSWIEGIKLIDRKLRSILEQEGVAAIEALGREFDPHLHEAVLREDGEGNVDVVVEELQKGYKLRDRVLRPTMVKVGKRSSTVNQIERG